MWIFNNKYIDIYIENPFKTWWKVRKYFKFPKLYISYTTKYYCDHWLSIEVFDITWKDKWFSPRHEISPLIKISIFKKLILKIYLEGNKYYSEIYWETILDYLYYTNDLTKALENNSGWEDFKGNKINPELICLKSKYHGKYL